MLIIYKDDDSKVYVCTASIIVTEVLCIWTSLWPLPTVVQAGPLW